MTSVPNPNAPTNIHITVDARTGPEQQTGRLSKRAEATYKATCDMIAQTGVSQPMPRREDFAHITDEDAPPLADPNPVVPVDLAKSGVEVQQSPTFKAMVDSLQGTYGIRGFRQHQQTED